MRIYDENRPHSYSSYLLLLVIICLFQIEISSSSTTITKSEANQYESDSDTYWRSISWFKPIQGSKYGVIKRRKAMSISLKIIYYGKNVWNEWENILRIGEYGYGNDSGCNEHGRRYPALFILPNQNELQISLSDKYECWFVIEKNYNLKKNIVYHLIINYNQTHSTISVSTMNATNNKMIEPQHLISNKSRTNDDSLLDKDMDIIISDPLTIPANVGLFDIVIYSYDDNDDILNIPPFPSASPTNQPTASPVITKPSNNDIGVVAMTVGIDYSSNNTNKSDTDEIIRQLTEDIMNNYIDEVMNNTSSNNTRIIVVINNIDSKEYDIILNSNYTTDNETAIYLEALFEDLLERELLEKISQSNGSIKVKNINFKITFIDLSDDNEQEQITETTETETISMDDDSFDIDHDKLIWYIIIGGSLGMFCVFLIGFCIGWKFNGRKHIKSRQIRLKSQISNDDNTRSKNDMNIDDNIAIDNTDDGNMDIGDIRNDEKLRQSSDDEYLQHDEFEDNLDNLDDEDSDYMEPINNNHNDNEDTIMTESGDINKGILSDRDIIRNTILEVMGTPSGIKPMDINNNNMNAIRLNKLDDMNENNDDDEDDEDIEDMYNKSVSGNIEDDDSDYLYKEPIGITITSNDTNMTPQVTVEGDSIITETAHVAIPYYYDD